MEVKGVRFPFYLMWTAGPRMPLSHPAGPNQILERIIVKVHPNPKSYYHPVSQRCDLSMLAWVVGRSLFEDTVKNCHCQGITQEDTHTQESGKCPTAWRTRRQYVETSKRRGWQNASHLITLSLLVAATVPL